MTPSTSTALVLANQIQASLASSTLPPVFARLYSQHTRLSSHQHSLPTWTLEEADERLNDATRLIEAGLIQRKEDAQGFRASFRRAAELMEWLAHPENNPNDLPLRLLSSAVYQLAGYPARANALLRDGSNQSDSSFLRAFLRADLPLLQTLLTDYWSTRPQDAQVESDNDHWMQREIVDATASALGVLCSSLRWNDETRVDAALNKLTAVCDVLLDNHEKFSWLLARLSSEVASEYTTHSMRHLLHNFDQGMTEGGQIALERYLRLAFLSKRAIAWPSQAAGITKLKSWNSFVLCTPTGSGKTTIAELAILQGLFTPSQEATRRFGFLGVAPLILYLVPSRALAAEVESRLSRVFRRLSDERVIVTGLYGGTDWGPTDAWLTSSEKTVLICTYEKAEALLRFMGTLFLWRVALVIVDEAHSVQFDQSEEALNVVRSSESRPLRLEALGMRLFSHVEENHSRVIALSAVAAGVENALAGWITGKQEDGLVQSSYRSTRQLVGRLECQQNRRFEIHYDLLDGADLRFQSSTSSDTPYIPNPFPPYPMASQWDGTGPEKRVRPYLLWAAMCLAAPDDKGQSHCVLISIAQQIQDYAADFLKLLDFTWSGVQLPQFFRQPADQKKLRVWNRCLQSCEDYFGRSSQEYRLLEKGIVLHYGRMPGLMARLLVDVVNEGIATIVVATSTLSEGVNLPVEVILIPSLRRHNADFTAREFRNLIGRAGRPGFATEGRALVLLCTDRKNWGIRQARDRYSRLITELVGQNMVSEGYSFAMSPLAALLNDIFAQWQRVTNSSSSEEFLRWLEAVRPEERDNAPGVAKVDAAAMPLDTLDGILLSAIVETDQLSQTADVTGIEDKLQRIWRRSYASFCTADTDVLEASFVRRGTALRTTIYPDSAERNRLYQACLPPRSATQLLGLVPTVRNALEKGRAYASWSLDRKIDYLASIVEVVGGISRFRCDDLVIRRRRTAWKDVLRWWVAPLAASHSPAPKEMYRWHRYASDGFVYRFSWGLGSFLAVFTHEAHDGQLVASRLEDWPNTGLPWIAFWIKELMIWGTVDPVVAFVLARGKADTRQAAQTIAQRYYGEVELGPEMNDVYDPGKIRDWVEEHVPDAPHEDVRQPISLKVVLQANFSSQARKSWRVLPVFIGHDLVWFDPAGFPFASCSRPSGWTREFVSAYDFTLDVKKSMVSASRYL